MGAMGMKAVRNERVKRRVLKEAVAENVDVIRGLPPRAVRPARRAVRLWLRRAPLLLVTMTVAGSSYLAYQNGSRTAPPIAAVPLRAATLASAAPVPVATEATPSLERVTASAFPLAVRRIVLDAGHGGTDPGATAGDVREKAITLDINNRLRQLLVHDGFDVVVTRDGDRTIALRERARVANDSHSDVFVSIHVNSLARHTESRGIETYYLGATSDPSLTQLAAAENRVSGYSLADMRKLLDGIYADTRRDESQALADAVQKQLFTSLRRDDAGLENWGVKRAPFVVLVATGMPAILAEVGCISNEKETAMLTRPEYRQQIAEALFRGIRAYAGAGQASEKKGNERNG